jgi:hypothetical protein
VNCNPATVNRCLEGRRPAPGELRHPSSGAVLALPGVTVGSLGLPSYRARNGHALLMVASGARLDGNPSGFQVRT